MLIDGKIEAAAHEERFSRLKHDSGFPALSIKFCLESSGIEGTDLDAIVFYENTFLKFDRILRSSAFGFPNSRKYFDKTLSRWVAQRKFETVGRICEFLRVSRNKIFYLDHHLSHAASAYYCSPFEEATIVTIDGVGEYETLTMSMGRGKQIEKIFHTDFPDSLGLAYSAFTSFLGFEVNEGEYKVMGMSAFGKPIYCDKVKTVILFDPDSFLRLDENYLEICAFSGEPFTQKMRDLFGPPRPPGEEFDVGDRSVPPANRKQEACRHYADIAASLQKVTEELLLHIVDVAVQKTGISNVCMAGGVALNSLANQKIQQTLKGKIYVQPAAGDGGSALGAALYHHHAVCGHARTEPMASVYIGKSYTDDETLCELRQAGIRSYKKFDVPSEMVRFVASRVAEGAVVGWSQGRFEWGPRALGARSILANPARPDMQSIVNRKIKFREPFRPFAPSVLEEQAHEFFDFPIPQHDFSPEFYMLSVAEVWPHKRSAIPAVTHVDGTARLQLVSKRTNPLYYELIEEFARIAGLPLLLNTSFNLKGEPIVSSPADAIKTFSWCDLDYLAIGKIVIWKDYGDAA